MDGEVSEVGNPLRALAAAGQSVWLDYLHRRILESGELARLIADDEVGGLTSNPAIFKDAITSGGVYDQALAELIAERDREPAALYEALAIADIQAAADAFRCVYDAVAGRDGFVSLEVSPHLAMDSAETVREAKRLWAAVDRPNLMIKVPGTPAGADAIRALVADGINVNVTLLFGLDAYLAAAEAHLAGLENRMARGLDVSRVHGVASFFVSRIDQVMDRRIDERPHGDMARALRGRIAIANAKLAYQRFRKCLQTPRWRALAAAGAAPQRLLWASTGTKDPAYSDVVYVEQLIGRDTVNTLPPKTLAAFRDHGRAAPRLEQDAEGAGRVLADAEACGLDLAGATAELARDGVAKFAGAFDEMLAAVADKRADILRRRLGAQAFSLPPEIAREVEIQLDRATEQGWPRRLWARDAGLWTGGDEAEWLGWLDAAQGSAVDLAALARLADLAAGRAHVLLLGMGGSSLTPEVIAAMMPPVRGRPHLTVLDSTDPSQIARTCAEIDLSDTLFIVASKSGSTLEPDLLLRHFFAAAEGVLGARAASRFVCITDPGSELERSARELGFAQILHGRPDIGGRFSALSHFGMAAAAVLGFDLQALLDEARLMANSCGPGAPPRANPGVHLGVVLGAAALAGRDKVTICASPSCAPLGAWLEQLLAESTGKNGVGVIPIDGEPAADPALYASDRVFVSLRLTDEENPREAARLTRLAELGHPVVHIGLPRAEGLFQEFVRWEIATAIAGAVLNINPFDQPDVEASKVAAKALTDAFERGERGWASAPSWAADGLEAFAPRLPPSTPSEGLDRLLACFLAQAGPGDYVGLLAWIDRNPSNAAALHATRGRILDRTRAATAVGFGPRFLHSTGQAYKGGPNSGLFIVITSRAGPETPVPGRRLTFAQVETAQALGDMDVLLRRGRRVLRIDLGDDVERGLGRFSSALEAALP